MSKVLPVGSPMCAVLQPRAKARTWALLNTGMNHPRKRWSKPEVWAVPRAEQELPRMPPALLVNLLNPTVIQQLPTVGELIK